MHQNEWFQVWFFKNFLGRGSPSPLPRPLPPLFLGLRPRFGLRPQFSGASRPRLGLRPRYSGASRPRFGLRPQLSIGDLGLAPPKINSWIRPCCCPCLNLYYCPTCPNWHRCCCACCCCPLLLPYCCCFAAAALPAAAAATAPAAPAVAATPSSGGTCSCTIVQVHSVRKNDEFMGPVLLVVFRPLGQFEKIIVRIM